MVEPITNDGRNQIDLLKSLSLDDTTEEKVDAVWRQMMIYKSLNGGELSESKSRRTQAEAAREDAEAEVVRTTQAACDRMRAEAEGVLQEASRLRTEAQSALTQAQSEFARATEVRSEAEQRAQQFMTESEAKANDFLEEKMAAARLEATELRRQALIEIRTMLSRVEEIGAATSEELETQRILTNVAKLRSSSAMIASEASLSHEMPATRDFPSIEEMMESVNGSSDAEVPEPVVVAEAPSSELGASQANEDDDSSSAKSNAKKKKASAK